MTRMFICNEDHVYRLPGDVELLNEENERIALVTAVGGKVSVYTDKRFGVLFLTVCLIKCVGILLTSNE